MNAKFVRGAFWPVFLCVQLARSAEPPLPASAGTNAAARPPRAELRQILPPPAPRVLRDVAYVSAGHEQQKLDLYLPATGTNRPLIVWVHGGAFRTGSKMPCPALFFLKEGYAVASINYRLSQQALFPAQIQDGKAAIRWLRAHAREHGIDPDRIGAWGSSAGGHLVALLGTAGNVKDFDAGDYLQVSSRVQAVCDWFGPTDFTVMNKYPGTMDHDAADSPESQLLGGPVQKNRDRAARANPVTYVTKDDPPFLIMHGDKDPLVPLNQSELLDAALKRAGVEVTFHVVKGAGHGFSGQQNLDLVRDFFARHLRPVPSK
jgi:acetyl esterase/lipase